MMGFIDQMRSEGFAVESIIRVLREQGVKIAARTYRAWKRGRVAVRTVTDAIVVDAVRDAAWRDETLPGGSTRRKMTPEGLYGRKKMTAFIRRTTLRDVSRGAVDRAMRALGLSGVTRAKAIRTTVRQIENVRRLRFIAAEQQRSVSAALKARWLLRSPESVMRELQDRRAFMAAAEVDIALHPVGPLVAKAVLTLFLSGSFWFILIALKAVTAV